jgi:hypothetical protein
MLPRKSMSIPPDATSSKPGKVWKAGLWVGFCDHRLGETGQADPELAAVWAWTGQVPVVAVRGAIFAFPPWSFTWRAGKS